MSAMPPKFRQFQIVALLQDLPEHGLKVGQIGTVLEFLTMPREAYEVEFIDAEGRTIALMALEPGQITAVNVD